jgi:hypothetical protein
MRKPDPHAKPHNNFLICQVANTDSKEVANASASQVTKAERSQAANAPEKQVTINQI